MSALESIFLVSAPPWGEGSPQGSWLECFHQKSPREIYLHDVLQTMGVDLCSPAEGKRTLPVWHQEGGLVVAAKDSDAFGTPNGDRQERPNRLYLRPGVCATGTLVLQPPADNRNVEYGAINGPVGSTGPAALAGRLLEEKGFVPPIPGQAAVRLVEIKEAPARRPDGWLNPVVTVWPLQPQEESEHPKALGRLEEKKARQLKAWQLLSGEARLEILPGLAPELMGRAGFLAWGAELLARRDDPRRSVIESLLWGRTEAPGRMPWWLALLALDQMGGSFVIGGHGQAEVADRPRLTWIPPSGLSSLETDVARILAEAWSGLEGLSEAPSAVPSLGRSSDAERLWPWKGSADWWKDRKLCVLIKEHPNCRSRRPFAAIASLLDWLGERGSPGSAWSAALRSLAASHLGGSISKLPDGSVGFDLLGYLESFGRRFVAPASRIRVEIPWPREGRGGTEVWLNPVASPAFGARLFAERVLTGLLDGLVTVDGERHVELGADVWWLPWAEMLFTHPADVTVALRERPGFILGSSSLGLEQLGRGSAISARRSEMRF